MCKRIIMLVVIFVSGLFCAGCDATGSLNSEEEASLMVFLVNENYIDKKASLSTDGVGEGELHNYYCNVSVNGDTCMLYVQQTMRKEDYRVFGISIKDSQNNVIDSFDVRIDRETGTVTLYQQ
ncbi:MAG: hypothetical protein ACI4RC_03600 [Oscillospiraceae bacterium]